MVGGDLTKADAWTVSLLTNSEVIAVDQHSTASRPAIAKDDVVVWVSESSGQAGYYVAAFNRTEAAMDVSYSWKDLGLKDAEYAERDSWGHKDLGSARSFTVKLPSHGCVLYRLRAAGSSEK